MSALQVVLDTSAIELDDVHFTCTTGYHCST